MAYSLLDYLPRDVARRAPETQHLPGNYCVSVALTRGVQYGHGHGHFLAIRLGFDPQNATSRGDFLWSLRGLN